MAVSASNVIVGDFGRNSLPCPWLNDLVIKLGENRPSFLELLKLGFDEHVDEQTDTVCDMHGVRVTVDKKSLLYLDGTEIDFHNGIDKRGFVFNNPNATKTCGCGSSFQA